MAGKKANFQWLVGPAIANQVFASTAAGGTSFQTLITFERALTIRRLIVDVFCMLDSVTTTASAVGRIGIMVANPRVVSVGATAVAQPATQGEVEWMWNRAFAIRIKAAGTEAIAYTPLHLHDDVRGMRKAKDNDSLILVIEAASIGAVLVSASVRCLFST